MACQCVRVVADPEPCDVLSVYMLTALISQLATVPMPFSIRHWILPCGSHGVAPQAESVSKPLECRCTSAG